MKLTRQPYWPKRWTVSDGAIYYQTRDDDQHLWDDRKWFKLGHTEPEAFSAWYARNYAPPDVPRTISECIDIFIVEQLPRLAESTQGDYRAALERIRRNLGDGPPGALKPRHVYAYMARLPDVQANRDKAVLSSLMSKVAVKRGAVDRNIVREVERNHEEPRDRYVTDDELERFYEYCTPELQCRIDMLWATGARSGQIRQLTLFAWDGEGLSVPKAKKGRTVRYVGTDLKEIIERLLSLRKGRRKNSEYLFCNRSGQMYTADGWRNIWQYAMTLYTQEGFERFQERDIRAKVASDSDSLAAAQERMGHQNSSTTNRVYRRRKQNVTTLDRKGKPDS